jgi:hypothetical protein
MKMMKIIKKGKKTLYIYPVILLLLIHAEALQSQMITGKLKNEQQVPIEYANVILLNPIDSSFISGTVTSPEGIFRLEDFSNDKKVLKISCLGYSTQFMDIDAHQSLTDLGEIILPFEANLLGEMVVIANISPFSMKNNHLIVQVATSILSSAGTAMDVIKHVPGISIRNDIISVFSQGAPIVYINNRRQYDLSELKQLQSSDIGTIELIASPDARYDAEGRSILLIKTKRNRENGLAVQLTGQLNQGNHFGDDEQIRLSYNHDKFSLFATYGHLSSAKDRNFAATYTIHDDTLWKQQMYESQIYYDRNNQVSMGGDWMITPSQIVGGQYQGTFGNNPLTSTGTENVLADEIVFDQISTLTDFRNQSRKHLFNAFYRGHYTDKMEVQVDMDYLNRLSKVNQQINESSPLENREVHLHSQSDFNLLAGKVAMTYQLGKKATLESGGEYSQIEGSGFLTNPEQYIKNNIYSNSEKKFAVFVNYAQPFGKLDFQIGARYERVRAKSTEDSTKRIKTNSVYQGFYPNLSLGGTIGKTQMGLTFAHKIKRPAFAQLNDNNYYGNRFLIQKGNPYLKSENIYQLDYRLSYETYHFTLGYVYKQDPIVFSMETAKDQSNLTIMTFANYPEYQEINMQLSTSVTYKRVQFQLSAGIRQPFFAVHYMEEKSRQNLLAFSISCFNDITFPGEYIFSLNFDYQGKNNYYTIASGECKSLDVGLRKSFLDKTLSFNLQIYDIFRWVTEDMTIRMNNISYLQQSKYETRYVSFTVNYRFHNDEKKYRGRNVVPEDMDRL